MAISGARSPDFWTKMRSIGLGVSSLFSDSYWLGSMVDTAANLEPKLLGISYYGFGVGVGMAVLTSTGLTICDYIINIRHQESAASSAPESTDMPENFSESLKKLYLWQKLALAMSFISCTGDVAGPIVVPVGILAFHSAPRWQKVLFQCGTTLFGGSAAVASVRTYCKNMRAINDENEEKRPIFNWKI